MAPIRRKNDGGVAQASSGASQHAEGNKKRKLRRKHAEPAVAVVPSVAKLKAALRQTKRLLAKENLAADVRVATERRLAAQEAELIRAETARKERTMATRYHKVKFFERQKVVRKITQTKRRLGSTDLSKSERKSLEKALLDQRVNLNYINHYPKTRKYISLFPPEARRAQPASSDSVEKAKTEAQRDELRHWIREQMDAGTLASEPEAELNSRGAAEGKTTPAVPPGPLSTGKELKMKRGKGSREKGKNIGTKPESTAGIRQTKYPNAAVAQDEFFESGSEESHKGSDDGGSNLGGAETSEESEDEEESSDSE